MQTPIGAIGDHDGVARRFERLISEQDRICRDLEALADTLPDRIDTLAAAVLADALYPTLRACQDLEEAHVFPAILGRNAGLEGTVQRLRAEHLEDEDQALMVAEAVQHFVRNPRRSEADHLGFLIRCLFQPLRRHAAFDRNIILPIYCSRLTIQAEKS